LFILKVGSVDLGVDLLTAVDVNSTSDERLKDNIKTLENPLETVNSLRGVSYDMFGKHKVGVIAQEVEAVVPEVVHTNDDGYKSVSYGNLVGVLIEAVKEQQKTIRALEHRITKLEE
jgi:ribonuclease PH